LNPFGILAIRNGFTAKSALTHPKDGAIHVTPTKALISLDNAPNALRYREPEKRKNGLSIKINHLTEITKP
jgi:hypothetical protein